MIRAAVFLLLLIGGTARAQTVSRNPQAFDVVRSASVYAAALAFMTPRTLEAVAPPELTLWGLNGITAIDPRLTTERQAEEIRLRQGARILATRPAPKGAAEIVPWARLAAEIQSAAYDSSPPVRAAGTSGIIRGFFDELFNHLDPYSRYTPPEEAEEDRARRAGQAGAGLTLVRRGGQIVVQSVISDGPAGLADIRAGDVILSVDGQSTRGKDADTVARWIRGPEDTSLTISWRGRDGRVQNTEITREMVPPETVHAEHVGIMLLLRVSDFNNGTGARVANEIALGVNGEKPAQGIVIDLRGNRGGVLRQAVFAADALLSEGVVATTVGRDPEANRVLRSTGGDIAEYVPVVVIVDGRTASAAEILAAALADRGRAVVVGSSTLGKGLVQTISRLPDGGELRVTWSRILAPRGWPIQTLGVLPQICTSLGQEALGRQMNEISAGRAPMAGALARHHAARPPLAAAEALAIRNACPAAEGREADMAVARKLIENPVAYAAALLPPTRPGAPTGAGPMAVSPGQPAGAARP